LKKRLAKVSIFESVGGNVIDEVGSERQFLSHSLSRPMVIM